MHHIIVFRQPCCPLIRISYNLNEKEAKPKTSKRTESSLPPFRTKTRILKIKKFTPSRSRYFFTTSPSGSGRKGVSDGTSNGV